MSKASDIAAAVLRDLSDRKGFDWWWDDLDDEIQADIEEDLTKTVQKVLDS